MVVGKNMTFIFVKPSCVKGAHSSLEVSNLLV